MRLVPSAAEHLEGGHASLVTANNLTIDEARVHLEVVQGLDNERETVRPVIASPGQQPDAHGVPTSHQAIAIVLDLVNPVRTRRRLVSGRRQARFDEACRVSTRTRQQTWSK